MSKLAIIEIIEHFLHRMQIMERVWWKYNRKCKHFDDNCYKYGGFKRSKASEFNWNDSHSK